jgi:ABC-2 type transport system permease protein
MFTLLKKELSTFLSSLIGYIAIVVFLIFNGLFLWIIEGESNVMSYGLANIDGLFLLAPWIFLFLIPAITMKMFAEEKKNGTIELLLTKPLSDISIIFSKFLAGVILVIVSILPTLIYVIAVYQLGLPKGNLDLGGIMGSYLGLVFLGSIFVAIGIFCSSLTDNQIIAFILSVVLSGIMYIGFEYLAVIPLLSEVDLLIRSLGINHHYSSISRGVIDTRDVIYYLSTIGLFLLLTKLCLESRNWKK